MATKVDLYSAYADFEAEILERVRGKTFVEDFGQNSWTTGDEYRRWTEWFDLNKDSHVLEVASGSGGPAIFFAELTGSRVKGIDINEEAVATAEERARAHGLAERVTFQKVDADAALPFDKDSFDALICIDAANHFPHRAEVFNEWFRVLRPGGKALFTDPVVVTGPVSNEELAVRSSVGFFLFVPPGLNERLIADAGFEIVAVEDGTEKAAAISKRWHDARNEGRDALMQIEGEERFRGLQDFFASVHKLTAERRLSRLVYLLRKHS